jgi:hypothetical protein
VWWSRRRAAAEMFFTRLDDSPMFRKQVSEWRSRFVAVWGRSCAVVGRLVSGEWKRRGRRKKGMQLLV